MKTAVALAICIQATHAFASAPTSSCDTAARAAAEAHGVPLQVMLAITRVETGRGRNGQLQPWPWAVNQAGQSYWFDTPDEAETFLRAAIDAGQSNIDIGCFQLNLRWHGHRFSSLRAMLDPWQNADHAARFLLENHGRTGNWVDAVAAYHSATPSHAKAYIEKVERVLTSLEGAEITLIGAAPKDFPSSPRVPRDNRFPLLQPGTGTRGALASLVPTGRALAPLLAPTP